MRSLLVLVLFAPSLVLSITPQQVFQKASSSVVIVKALTNAGEIVVTGSGVIISKEEVVTNCHVADRGHVVAVYRQEIPHKARLAARLAEEDLCMLRVRKLNGQPAEIGNARSLKVGDAVYAIGAPKGLDLSLSNGLVSQLRGDGDAPLIQTTTPISPGSSGGGLFDASGRLIGITTFYVKGGQNLNFAMPVEWLSKLRESKQAAHNKFPHSGDENRAKHTPNFPLMRGGWYLHFPGDDWFQLLHPDTYFMDDGFVSYDVIEITVKGKYANEEAYKRVQVNCRSRLKREAADIKYSDAQTGSFKGYLPRREEWRAPKRGSVADNELKLACLFESKGKNGLIDELTKIHDSAAWDALGKGWYYDYADKEKNAK